IDCLTSTTIVSSFGKAVSEDKELEEYKPEDVASIRPVSEHRFCSVRCKGSDDSLLCRGQCRSQFSAAKGRRNLFRRWVVLISFEAGDLDAIELADNKYLIGRTNHLKSGSKNLDFHLANHRVTLWGSLEDVLVKKVISDIDVLDTGMLDWILHEMAMAAFESLHRIRHGFFDVFRFGSTHNDLSSNDVQKGVADRMYAYLMNQHDETMAPLVDVTVGA
nr:pantothenate kinase 1 [Tanacetum cinerariifolium]